MALPPTPQIAAYELLLNPQFLYGNVWEAPSEQDWIRSETMRSRAWAWCNIIFLVAIGSISTLTIARFVPPGLCMTHEPCLEWRQGMCMTQGPCLEWRQFLLSLTGLGCMVWTCVCAWKMAYAYLLVSAYASREYLATTIQ